MPISTKLLEMINRDAQNVPVAEERWPELAIELNQLRDAAEAALRDHKFDRNPHLFVERLRSRRV